MPPLRRLAEDVAAGVVGAACSKQTALSTWGFSLLCTSLSSHCLASFIPQLGDYLLKLCFGWHFGTHFIHHCVISLRPSVLLYVLEPQQYIADIPGANQATFSCGDTRYKDINE